MYIYYIITIYQSPAKSSFIVQKQKKVQNSKYLRTSMGRHFILMPPNLSLFL